jgi:ankyrin repeat protein
VLLCAQVVSNAREKRDAIHHGRLCAACAKGQLDTVREILANTGVEVNRADLIGRRALHLAACAGNLEMVQLLVKANADLNVADWHGGTPLSDSLRHNHSAVAEWLWANGAQRGTDTKVEDLCMAAATDREHLKQLCQFGIDVNMVDHDQRSALHIAAAAGQVECCQLLAESGAHVSARDRWGCTPLEDALLFKQDSCGEYLLTLGAILGTYDIAAGMCEAAALDDLEHLERLIKFKGDVNVQDRLGRTPLHVAAARVRISACHYLLNVPGIEVNKIDIFGNSPLDDAEREEVYDHPVVRSLLTSRGALRGNSSTRRVGPHAATSEDQLLEAQEHGINSFVQMRKTVTELNTWIVEQHEAMYYFRVMIEEAIQTEKHHGFVLAEDMPELWQELRSFADALAAQRDYCLDIVYPSVKHWSNEIPTQDVLGETLRVLQTTVRVARDARDRPRLAPTPLRALLCSPDRVSPSAPPLDPPRAPHPSNPLAHVCNSSVCCWTRSAPSG